MTESLQIGQILTWNEVVKIHNSRRGIAHHKGKLISLLTDLGKLSPCYPDFHGKTKGTIFYTGSGKRGNQKLDIFNQSLLAAVKTEDKVPLFCKIAVNKWEFMGLWRVVGGEYIFSEDQNRMVWLFHLVKAD